MQEAPLACYLKTKQMRYKLHYIRVEGLSINFHRHETDAEVRQTHSLQRAHVRCGNPVKGQDEQDQT